MWLLNTTSLTLELVEDTSNCPYTILSHTWEHGEITFKEIQEVEIGNLEIARRKPGFSKIKRTCQLARDRGIKYAWVDTCCIDKSSSAELSEAINSMFQWYKDSAVCFVFLSDLPALADRLIMNDYFPRCRWFKRGWTLQELIASKNIEFYDQGWNIRGNKMSLQPQLSEITGIDGEVLRNSDALYAIPVARRMSWAAMRVTSRLEDIAYCLFGIFDVHLPLIYGEGSKAFTRLQEAIAQDNNDMSLLAWTSVRNDQDYRGVLARSPVEFKRCGSVQSSIDPTIQRTEFSITNKGFHIISALSRSEGDFLLNLQCVDGSIQQAEGTDGIIAIRIIRTMDGFVRHQSDRLVVISRSNLHPKDPIHIHIPKIMSFAESESIKARLTHRFVFEVVNTSPVSYTDIQWPSHLWDEYTNSFFTDGSENFTGVIKVNLIAFEKDFETEQALNYHPPSSLIATSSQLAQMYYYRADLPSIQTPPHSSGYYVVFGLETLQNSSRNSILGRQPLKPWAGIYKGAIQEIFSQVNPEEENLGFPYGLNQVRQAVRGVSNSHHLPQTLVFNPAWHLRARSRTVPVNAAQVQLSLSTEIVESNPIGMYRLALKISQRNEHKIS